VISLKVSNILAIKKFCVILEEFIMHTLVISNILAIIEEVALRDFRRDYCMCPCDIKSRSHAELTL